MKKYILLLLVLNIIFPASACYALVVKSALENDAGRFSFSDFTQVKPGNGVAFVINSKITGRIKISSSIDDVITQEFFLDVIKDVPLYIPSKDKSIVIESTGTHKFSFKQGSEVRFVTLFCPADRTVNPFSNEIDLSSSITKTIKLPYSALHSKAPKKYIPEPISIRSKMRSVGSELYKEKSDAVVLVRAENGEGSGVIISEDGKIITNKHVVGDFDEVLVMLLPNDFSDIKNANEYLSADVIKYDDGKDLALLKLKSLPQDLNTVEISTDVIDIASEVHAIGHPRGNYWTYTKGYVSQIRNGHEWTGDGKRMHNADVIQTQTPINPGNSGGPLFNEKMKLVGINSFGNSDAEGLNFAVAASSVRAFLNQPEANVEAKQIFTDISYKFDGVALDSDENGIIDTVYLDRDENGKPDLVVIDEDEDGEPDVLLFDENENTVVEKAISIHLYEGKIVAIIEEDLDEDEEFDVKKFDIGWDGTIDKVVTL